MKPIRAFIIDDSVLIRYGLTQLLNQESDIEVVGDASDHKKIADQIKASKANILIFDIPLPREQGIERLKKINKLRLPSVVFTKSDTTFVKDLIPLLEAGAVGFILKPDIDDNISLVKNQILYELRRNIKPQKIETTPAKALPFLYPLKLVAIGSSTGGPEALSEIIRQFPADFPAAIAIVQHMPADFTTRFAQRLDQYSQIRVKEAQEGDLLEPGVALLAPGDFHMTFQPFIDHGRRRSRVHLTLDPPQWKLRPTVDRMMLSLAPIYTSRMIGVILTGMGEDGVIGMREIKKYHGITLVQNQATSVVFGMGQEVIKNNLADEVLPLTSIVPRICELIH